MMPWRHHLHSAWQAMPSGLRRRLLAAVVVAFALIVLAFAGPHDLQLPAVLALVGVLLLVQGAVLWHLWRQPQELRQARRAFMQGDFEAVVRLLESTRPTDITSQTLLGNAYRQLGRLAESEQILRAVHETEPDTPFPAYGLGRTLLALGRYNEAIQLIAHALEHRGQPVIVADLGHAQYRAGQKDEANVSLVQADRLELEPHRALMTRYLLWRLGGQSEGEALHARLARYDHGLTFWQVEAQRFHQTPYGKALTEDLAQLERLLEGAKHE